MLEVVIGIAVEGNYEIHCFEANLDVGQTKKILVLTSGFSKKSDRRMKNQSDSSREARIILPMSKP